MRNAVEKIEIEEAIDAGERALESLRNAQEKLRNAKNWGLVDLFGGGLFTDFMKHSKIKDARAYLEDAKKELKIFRRELKDVRICLNLDLEISDLLKITDFFFDNPVSDYLVQSKINETREQVDEAILQVESILSNLAYARDHQ